MTDLDMTDLERTMRQLERIARGQNCCPTFTVKGQGHDGECKRSEVVIMMDLREFLKVLEEEHELQKIKAEVDPKHELGAICKIHNERANSPALLFENVKGHNMSVVGQLLASDNRVALALGLSQANVFDETVRRASQPIPTRLVASGQCQEVVYEGKDVDVTKLPLCTNNPRDGGPYITAGHVIIRDPEYGNNLAIYRMMLVSKNEVTIRFTPGHDGHDFIKNAENAGKKSSRSPSASVCRRRSTLPHNSSPVPASSSWKSPAASPVKLWMW